MDFLFGLLNLHFLSPFLTGQATGSVLDVRTASVIASAVINLLRISAAPLERLVLLNGDNPLAQNYSRSPSLKFLVKV